MAGYGILGDQRRPIVMNWGNYGWGMGFGWIWMILFWGLVIAGIVYIVQAISRKAGQSGPEDTPLDILKKRYAKGEITKEEFDRMKEDLMKS
jgi:putative membrane protein